jgi:hypothetical protein
MNGFRVGDLVYSVFAISHNDPISENVGLVTRKQSIGGQVHYWVKWREEGKKILVEGIPMLTYGSGWHTKEQIKRVKKND